MNIEEYKEHRRRLKEDPEYLAAHKLKEEEDDIKYWMNLKPFEKAGDVCHAYPKPITDFHINRLIELGAIPKKDLEDGVWYYGDYRNANLGKWDAVKNEFGHWRYKFGFMWDTCKHFEDDNMFALFVPLRKANEEELNGIKEIEDGKEKMGKYGR
jgi:hypothetical protein